MQSCDGFDTGLVPSLPSFVTSACHAKKSWSEIWDDVIIWRQLRMQSQQLDHTIDRHIYQVDVWSHRALRNSSWCLVPAHFLLEFPTISLWSGDDGCANLLISRVEGTELSDFFAKSSDNNTIERFWGRYGSCTTCWRSSWDLKTTCVGFDLAEKSSKDIMAKGYGLNVD